jgi:hypothetical protein
MERHTCAWRRRQCDHPSAEETITNRSIRVLRGPWRARPPAARTAAAIVAAACLVPLAAGCGSPSSTRPGGSSNAGGSQTSQLLAFAHCMRSHGVPNFPDPSSADKFPGWQQLGVSSSQYQAALNACKHLLPNGGSAPSQAELQQQKTALLPFAQCMRTHGVSDWPDPSIYTNTDGDTAVAFIFIGTSLDGSGFDAPQVQAKINTCQHLLPASDGGPPFRIVRSHG